MLRWKVLFLTSCLILLSFLGFSQANNISSKVVNVGQTFYLRGYRIDSVSADTVLTSPSDNVLATQKSVKTYITNRLRFTDSSTVNVQWFTGVPDGIHDNSTGIQAAFAYAAAHHKDISVPGGTYVDSVALNAPTTGYLGVSWLGTPSSTILYPVKTGHLFVYASAAFTGVRFKSIKFISNHDTTAVGNNAIFFQGIGTTIIKDVKIEDCEFMGFSTALTFKGVQGLDIGNCTFLAQHGHDDATTTSAPAVFIRSVYDSVGDMNRNWNIHNCYFDGYSGTNITSTLTGGPMDGSFYGPVSGMIFAYNFIYRMAQEAISVQPQFAVTDSAVVQIIGNQINEYLPAGSKTPSGGLITQSYGIRIESPNYIVSGNVIVGATIGIYSNETPWVNQFIFYPTVTGNTIYFNPDPTFDVKYGILVQGYSDSIRSKYATITGNNLYLNGITLQNTFKFVSVLFCDSSQVRGNTISQANLTRTGGGTYGTYLYHSTGNFIDSVMTADTAIVTNTATYTIFH